MSSTTSSSENILLLPAIDSVDDSPVEAQSNQSTIAPSNEGVTVTNEQPPTWTDSSNNVTSSPGSLNSNNTTKVIKESCIYTNIDETVTTTEKITHIMPPMDCSGDLVNLNKQFTVEVYENERYAPFSNWSASSLLPSDRSNFSTKAGMDGYTSLAEVSTSYLSKGWTYVTDSKWTVEIIPNKTDSQGWIYAVNFGSIEDGVSTKGIMHFVRRRRLTRDRIFDVKSICDISAITNCFCDSIEVEHISYQLVQAVSASSLLRYLNHISLPKVNIIKNELIAMLSLDLPTLEANINLSTNVTNNNINSNSNSIRKPSITTSIGSSICRSSSSSSSSSSPMQQQQPTNLDQIKSRINAFSQQGRSIWSSAACVLGVSSSESLEENNSSNSNNAIAVNRVVEIADHYFPFVERTEIAKLILRIHDNEGFYHCKPLFQNRHDLQHSITTENIIFDLSSQSSTATSTTSNKIPLTSTTKSTLTTLSCTIETCQFIPFHCTNQGCSVIISKKWAQQHDDVCAKKIVSCPRHGCMTTNIKREDVKHHLNTVCDFKPVQCPFYELGCIADLVQKDVATHVDACTNSHLLLALNTVRDQTVTVKKLDQKLVQLQEELKRTNTKVVETQTSVVGMTTSITVAEQRQLKLLKNHLAETEEKLSQRINSVNSHSRSEVSRLSKYMVDLNTKIQQITLQLKPQK